MLGTGTPNPDPERSGPALAVVAGGRPYLVDCGAGVVRRAEAARRAGIESLAMPNLTRLFITHLHSDHTLGCPDLILTPWVLARDEPLEVYAKAGWDRRTPGWQAYHAAAHTSGVELGELAARARPKLLVLTHQLMWGATEEQLMAEIRQHFHGEVAFAYDLDVY